MKKVLWTLTIAVLCLTACDKGYHRTDRGVIVDVDLSGNYERVDQTSRVMLEVMGEKLIHVRAVQDLDLTTDGKRPTAKHLLDFPQDSSLIIVPDIPKVPFRVESTEDSVFVITNSLMAGVDRKTGIVRFQDVVTGEVISEELGRDYQPIEKGGKQAFSVCQAFITKDDEGLYGLGQHQADEFNYKDRNEELFQYNTKVSVPFIVSTHNYGILWDNYSLTRFGNPGDYMQLDEVFTLYNKVGEQGSLTGTYKPAKGKTLVRNEDRLYFEHLDREDGLRTVVNLPKNFDFSGATVTYEGEIEPSGTGLYRFILYYAGYMKVYIDNELVVPERWRTAWNPNSYKFAVNMEADRRVPIRIEWKPDGGVSYCGLRVIDPSYWDTKNQITWWSEMANAIDYYFIYGDSMDEVISGYRTLTGKSQIMPKWAMGYWQSREKYNNQEELVSTFREFRKRQVPIDNIVQDWFYWREDQWGSHEFDPARFPNPKQMVDDVHNMGGHIMISVWPKFYVNTEHYKEFDANGWMYQQAVKDDIHDWVGEGYVGSFYDAYSAPARQLFWNQMKDHLYPLGFDAWWMDASEPNIRDCTDVEYRKLLCGPTALGPSDEYFNAYALMNAEAIYDGQRSADNDKRVFLLTRSGFAGLQRYSTATWSGDIATRWEDLKAQISAGLNFAVSGIPYWTMDIGGFCVENRYVAAQQLFDRTGIENADLKEWRELNTRWYQFGAFCPLYRAHGQFPLREVWNIAPDGHPAYQSIVAYTKLRYNLMPYIYSLAGMTYFKDYTIMRPLVMDFTFDKQVYNIGDQYMFGPAFMVAPIYKYGVRTRDMYFPAGKGWYDFYSGKFYAGSNQQTVDAPYEKMPLFVKAGSIVPFGPDIQYAMEKQPDEITLFVYAGADADFTLYEDEGVNYGYEQGKYAMIPMHYSEADRKLTIGDRQGSFPGMLQKRVFKVVKVTKDKPVPFDLNAASTRVDYDGNAVSMGI